MTAQPITDPALRSTLLDRVAFNADGLITAVAQDHATGEVLMLAWMNRAALDETLATGRVCYFSRSRKSLWRKGERSGQVQTLVDARLDCDGDAVLLLVEQKGVACHTGRRTCFYTALRPEGAVELMPPEIAPDVLYGA
ncbi:phosphoribosyl-AMP cyclohydrolase [Ameyamaea chiangmaiensis NBRC 103196]|uniref:Phosphoribosyl-AMP cyclohydrolase n=1 Tax=Ameyamaea chiangmaiensis TaxID=442969 RepID=A0A850PG02_9PROT|nr:phosphoribosyl-AMP cyclohydrolase [Ameyamaea chiangmaiensis]MBS4074255.1 phosphoribosyl-AMP cyclohydrolase [Ameyamaea chiangmaiensis]NVN41569.1 phosphoribosyl-AMP cyclohydrolase [Ameyamaea chiangmaiensis]GBQ71394.1 phosphoribosyl-AMP cyclohydrolase [Ameyamaea chiangmaiensis NBRC 103196]